MRDYLLKFNGTIPEDVFDHIPPMCDFLPINAYSDVGYKGDYDPELDEYVGYIPPTRADGNWALLFLDTSVTEVPAYFADKVQSDGDRDVGLPLPTGIAQISPVWAGMIILY